MKNIRIYGDSYSSACYSSNSNIGYNWTSILSKKLNCLEINRAVPGTSNAVIYTRLMEDIQKEKFSDSDTECIIFQFSTLGRYYNQHILDNFPDACSGLLHSPAEKLRPPVQKYYDENEEHIKWAISEYCSDVELHHMFSTLYWLKYYVSVKFPTIKIVVLFNVSVNISKEIDFSLLTTTDNFISLNHFSLTKASFSEFVGNKPVKFTRGDVRANHLTNPNLAILADAIFNIINTNDKTYLNYDIFHKNNFKEIENKKQYDQMLTDDIICYVSDIYESLPE
jgi:hypothetical protein